MNDQEFYKFEVIIPVLTYPKGYEFYDGLTEELVFSGTVKGYFKPLYILCDNNGVELIRSEQGIFLKDGKEFASFEFLRPEKSKAGYYEIETKTQSFRTTQYPKKHIYNFFDEKGKNVLNIIAPSIHEEIIVEVDPNFDVSIASILTMMIVSPRIRKPICY